VDTKNYLAIVWKYASKLVRDNFDWSEERIEREMHDLVYDFFDMVFDANDGDGVTIYLNDKDEIAGQSLSNPDELMALLKVMGVMGGKIHWRLGTHKGRAKNVVEGISFTWSIHDSISNTNSILTYLIHITDQTARFSFFAPS
jgi:hypothetical protein